MPTKTLVCPCCGKRVKPAHFVCTNLAKAWAHDATGDKKRRSPEHYQRMVEIRRANARRKRPV